MQEIIKLNELNTKCGSNSFLKINIIDKNKPIILISPGGAYEHISTRENEPVSNKFLGFGYNTAVLNYATFPETYPINFNDIVESFKYLKEKFQKVFIMGFSAGGHLTALLGTSEYAKEISGMILCYPVISMSKLFHKGSRENFLGKNNTEENAIKFSIENRVSKDTPPTFIWTTKTDQAVPYENSLMMIEALKNNNIKCEYKIFEHGRHGLALADMTAVKDGDMDFYNEEVQIWPTLVNNFLKLL